MAKTQRPPSRTNAIATDSNAAPQSSPTLGLLVAATAGLAAALVAAGSTGLMGGSLRHALTWLLLGTAIVAAWPTGGRLVFRAAGILLLAVVTVGAIASGLTVVDVLSVAVVLAGLAALHTGRARTALSLAASAAAALGVYVFARSSMPWFWLLLDRVGWGLGSVAGLVTRQPLWVGPHFAGLDYLVLMAALYAGWLAIVRPPLGRAIVALLLVVVGHYVYLVAVSRAALVVAELPAFVPGEGRFWTELARATVPWNLPALAGVIHVAIAVWMLHYLVRAVAPSRPAQIRRWVTAAAVVLAAALPAATALTWQRPRIEGKKIVFYEKGFLNWLKPQQGKYGRLEGGMYGMMPLFVESLGARCLISPALSEEDLRDADALVLFYPNRAWEEGQLERIGRFVRRGGSLLVFGEHTVREADGGARFNDVLKPTAMRVPFDSAMFEVGGWLESYEALAHATSAGIRDERNEFGVVIGASVEARWPARPLLIGRFGYAEPGDPSTESMMGNRRYEAGEKLGDIVLAAEQPLGAGKVVAFGDTSGFTNGLVTGTHPYVSRLLGYLCDAGIRPLAGWRQIVGLLGAAGLIVLIGRAGVARVMLVSLALAGSLLVCQRVTTAAGGVLPDGRYKTPNNLAYFDTTHLEVATEESWRSDGLMGLMMAFMRDNFVALGLPEFTAERLERAALLVSVAPSREFSAAERRILRTWVESGGVFICTVGYERSRASRSVLADYGFWVGTPLSPADRNYVDPEPLGHFKSPYVNMGDYLAFVRYHAAWPIGCSDPQAQVVTYGPNDTNVIIACRVGRGRVVVVGDTGFAMNKNLEREGGQPFEGMYENADFWRWFIPYLTDRPRWYPPRPTEAATTPTSEAAGETQPESAPAGP